MKQWCIDTPEDAVVVLGALNIATTSIRLSMARLETLTRSLEDALEPPVLRDEVSQGTAPQRSKLVGK